MSALTRDDVVRMAVEARLGQHLPAENGLPGTWCGTDLSSLERLVALAYAAGQAAEREACGKTRAGKPRQLQPFGSGAFLASQQYCFEKGWKEGAASVRAAIRARGQQ